MWLIAGVVLLAGCAGTQQSQRRGPPYAADRLLKLPRPFEVGIITTDGDEYGPALAPDGRTMYLVKRVERGRVEYIYSSQFNGERWIAPRVAGFSGQWFDKEPFVSLDGKRIYFASNRPWVKGNPPRDVDIWFVEKKFRGWSEAARVDFINSDSTDSYPALTADGTIYFASNRPGGRGDYDIYRSRLVNGKYTEAQNLGDAINTPGNEADPYIAPDESYMIFSSVREGGYGEGDLYISYQSAGQWSAPEILPTSVNSREYEYTPLISPDGRYLFFSRGWGDIFQVDVSAAGIKLNR
jgi:Tol biopolymer transport system component